MVTARGARQQAIDLVRIHHARIELMQLRVLEPWFVLRRLLRRVREEEDARGAEAGFRAGHLVHAAPTAAGSR